MSGSRGRKVTTSRPSGDPRWPERQQSYYNQNTSIPDLRSGWDNWNYRPTTGYNSWQHSSNLHQVWPSTQYPGGYYSEDRHPRTGSFDQFQHRFPNSFNPPNHFAERSLAHLNHTPLNELTSGSHSGSRDLVTSRESSSSHNKQPISAKDKQNVQSVRSKANERSAADRSRKPSSESQQDSSNKSLRVPVSIVEKPASVPAKSASFMPPNDDLRNKVKASLEKIAAAKEQASPQMNSSTPVEPLLPSSPQKVRESRVPTVETIPSPTTRHTIRLPSGCHRRTSQSSLTSNSAANNDASSNPLEGIGFIQNTSSQATDQTARVTSAATISGNDVPTPENEPVTSIPKDQLNKYIRSMDNHQRRQLVEQPRAIISQYMLNHLVQENQTARARQLSSLRFRVSSNELEFSSRTETNVILSEELVDEFKELLSRDDDEPVTSASTSKKQDSEDEEIQVLEPPPKEPPLCIDLDLDEKSSPDASPSPVTRLPAENPVGIQQDKNTPISSRIESPSNRNNITRTERTPASPLVASSRPAVASPEVVPVSEEPVQTSVVTETTTVSQAPCPVSVSTSSVAHCNPPSTVNAPMQPQSTQNRPSSASTNTPPCITTTVSAGKKSFLEKPSKNKKRKERRELQKKNVQEKPSQAPPKSKKQKKNKKKSPTTSPVKTNAELMIHWRQAQSTSENKADAGETDKTKKVASALERAESLEKGPQSGRTKSALNFLLIDLQAEEQEGKNRIALIDRTIEELQLERKALTDNVLALKQKQFDLLRSAMCSNTFDDGSSSAPLESVKTAIKPPPVTEAKDDNKVVEDKTSNDHQMDTSTVQATPSVASVQLLSLMHQLEENGVQVNLGDVELAVPSDPTPPVCATTLGNKRKRINGDDSKQPKKKGTPTNSPSRNATGAQTVEKPDQLPGNSLLIHPIQSSNVPGPLQTVSVSQTNQISSTISAVIAQSIEPNNEKKAASPLAHGGQSKKTTTSETAVAAESQTSSNESPITKSHNVAPPAVKTVEPKKTMIEKTVADKIAPKTSQTVEKETISRATEAVRTYSRREDSTNQKNTTPKPAPVNTQSTGTNAKTPRPTGPSQVIDLAATQPIPTEKATSCPVPAEVAPPPSVNAASSPDPCNFVLLRSHQTSVRCVFICGPCAFTASEDGTVHIYDLMTNSLSMRILGHTKPVTWLYAASLNTPSEVLKTVRYTTEYLNHLTLITGSEDAHIRQFSLDSGALLHEKFCEFPLTCVVGHKLQSKLYVGTTEGTIYTYTPKLNALKANKFKANAEVIFMKILVVRGKRAIIVAARRMDPVIYDLETEEALLTLTSNIPSSSFYSISTAANLVFCCDANKNVFKFDINSDKPLCQTDTLPSAAVGSFYDGKRYLVLGCMDGVIRVLDTTQKPPSRLFALPGHVLKTLTCMRVSGERIVGGSLNGEVAYCRLPNLEALSKSQP